jgi:membrane protease YdiL (CAAX protease family)
MSFVYSVAGLQCFQNSEISMAEPVVDVVEIYRARNLPEAYAIRLLMESEGIAVSISNEILQGIVGETAMGWSTSPRLLARRQDAERARILLANHTDRVALSGRSTSEDSGICLACGTVMDDDSDCPACGWSYGEDQIEGASPNVRNSELTAPQVAADQEAQSHNDSSNEGILPTISDNPILSRQEVWFELAAVMCIGFVPHLVNSLLPFDYSSADPYWVTATQRFVYSLASTFATLYIIHRSGERWRDFGFGGPRVPDVVLGLILLIVTWYFASLLQLAITQELTPGEIATGLPVTSFDYFLMMIMYASSALSEEVIMRSYLITRLRHLIHRPWLCVVSSSVLFASYHGYQGTEDLVNALFFGLVLGSVFAVYPRIWPLVICHTLTNIFLELAATG